MHSSDVIAQFVDLRIRGNTLVEISDKLSIPKSTLHDWEKRHFDEIQLGRAAAWEYVEAGVGLSREADLIRLGTRLQLCEEELSRRSLAKMSDSEVIRLTFATRREYFKRRDPLLKPLEHPRRHTPTPNLTLTPHLNGHTKPEKTGQKPEIHSNSHNGNHLPKSDSVTPDVRRGHFSSESSSNTATSSADAVHDQHQSSHPPTFTPADPPADANDHSPPNPSALSPSPAHNHDAPTNDPLLGFSDFALQFHQFKWLAKPDLISPSSNHSA